MAQDFTVGEDALAGLQTMSSTGDLGIIEPGGSIDSNSTGVRMNASDQILRNGGTINTTGGTSIAVDATFGTTATIYNSGRINSTHTGIHTGRDNTRVYNSGNITTTSAAGWGIRALGENTSLNNSGVIDSDGIGVQLEDRGVTLQNSGNISGATMAVRSLRDSVTVTNSGVLSSAGTGVWSFGNDFTVRNSGRILGGDNFGTAAIYSFGSSAHVINSGEIISQGDAIRFSGNSDDTLTLLPGSVIAGNIILGDGNDRLEVGNGLSVDLSFGTAGPEIIDTRGAPFAVSGTRVAVLDTTGFAAADNAALDLLGSISGVLLDRLSESRLFVSGRGPHSGGSALRRLVNTQNFLSNARPLSDGPSSQEASGNWWVKGFGGYRQLDSSGSASKADHRYGGGAMGVDGALTEDLRLGLHGGVSYALLEAEYQSQDIETTSVFGGVYGSHAGWLDFAVTAGASKNDSKRRIANNTLPGGVEIADADYNGYFISPEVTLHAGSYDLGWLSLKPSFRARYSFLRFEDYNESGSTGLEVGERDIQALDGRLQLAVPLPLSKSGLLELRIGVDGRLVDEEDIETTLLGQSLQFDPGGESTSIAQFVGVHYAQEIGEHNALFFTTELGRGSEYSLRADAQAGLRLGF